MAASLRAALDSIGRLDPYKGAALVAALAIAFASWLLIRHARVETEERGRATRATLAHLIAARQEASIRAIDDELRRLRQHWQQDPSGFAATVERHTLRLNDLRVAQVAVLDAGGRLAYSRMPSPERSLDLSDRAYFRAHLASSGDDLVVSDPILERVTNAWSIQFSRPLRGADGAFQGVVALAIPPPALEAFLRDIDLGPGSVITLARLDGGIIARSTGLERAAGTSIAGSVALDPAAPPAGDFHGKPRVDSIARIFNYRRFDGLPFVVLIGQRESELMASFVPLRNLTLVFGIAGCTLVLLIGWLLSEMRRRARAAELAQQALRLELHDGCIQSLYAIGLALDGTRKRLAATGANAMERDLADAEVALSAVMQDLRSVIGDGGDDARPQAGLGERLRGLLPSSSATATAFRVDVQPEAAASVDEAQSAHLVRIAREAVSNILRHAGARNATLALRREGQDVVLEACDDGAGIGPRGEGTRGLGLRHIHARARTLQGVVELGDAPEGGTRVAVRFPAAHTRR